MKEQKFLIIFNGKDLDKWLTNGWEVKNITAQHVTNGYGYEGVYGGFGVLLEKTEVAKQLNS